VTRRFDIMMPAYGDVELMKSAVRSVLAQDTGGWHLTVIDDCMPTPEPARWIAELDDPRVTYLRNERNLGLNANFRRAAELATAEHLVVMGTDDVMLPGYVAALGRVIDAHPEATVVQPGVEVVDADGLPVRPVTDRVKALVRPSSTGPVALAGEKLVARLLVANWTYFPSLCWRTEAVRAVGFRPGLEVVLDLALLLDLATRGATLVVDPEVTFRYRRHAASTSSTLALTGARFAEQEAFYRQAGRTCAELGWSRARRAAHVHLTSRLHAATLVPGALGRGDLTAGRALLRHALR
jgi:glycosyltransferase involved in cell wall biosynthesis